MVKTVDPKTAHELMTREGFAYVDVRTEEEFQQGHPEGSYNIPVFIRSGMGMAPNPRFLEVVRAHFPTDSKLLMGCASGRRSDQAAQMLLQAGYEDVSNVVGGFSGSGSFLWKKPGWKDEGLPVETDAGERSYDKLA